MNYRLKRLISGLLEYFAGQNDRDKLIAFSLTMPSLSSRGIEPLQHRYQQWILTVIL